VKKESLVIRGASFENGWVPGILFSWFRTETISGFLLTEGYWFWLFSRQFMVMCDRCTIFLFRKQTHRHAPEIFCLLIIVLNNPLQGKQCEGSGRSSHGKGKDVAGV